MLGLARALAVEQGRHDGIGRRDAAKLVGKDRRSIGGRGLRVAH